MQNEKLRLIKDTKAVSRWLYICAGGACATVLLGGATRLTESGLSMTSWDLIKDITRPQSEEDWMREFERYKTYPEYEEVHADMTLPEFKAGYQLIMQIFFYPRTCVKIRIFFCRISIL